MILKISMFQTQLIFPDMNRGSATVKLFCWACGLVVFHPHNGVYVGRSANINLAVKPTLAKGFEGFWHETHVRGGLFV